MVEQLKESGSIFKEPSFTEVVLLFGLISLFGDIMYEGARGVLVPYLDFLKVSVFVISVSLGLAEFLGFVVRVFSGIVTDKWRLYWAFIFLGYGMLIALPFIGFTDFWLLIVIFYAVERVGKAIYAPSEDAVFSSIAKGSLGRAFGYRELLDQTGAVVGPIILAVILYVHANDYQLAFWFFFVPFFCIMLLVYLSYKRLGPYSKQKMQLDKKNHEAANPEDKTSLPKNFHLFGLAIFFNALGLVYVFTYIAVITTEAGASQYWMVSLFYGAIMFVQGIVSPFLGYLYDRYGAVTIFIPFVVALVPAFTLLDLSLPILLLGCIFFGITLSGQDTIFKAMVGELVTHRRGTAYSFYFGYLNTGLLVSSIIFGYLVEQSLQNYAWIIAVVFEVIAFILLTYSIRNKPTAQTA